MYCVSCKKKIPDDALFCLYCGKKQAKMHSTYHRRGNGLGTVYRSKTGTWTAESTLGYYIINGKKKRKKARKYGFKTKKEAVQYLEQLADMKITLDKSVTFSELWEMFLPELDDLSKSKAGAYRLAWRKIKRDLEFRKIADVTASELADLAELVAPSYYPRKDVKNLLSHLYKIALRDEYVDKDRSVFIKLPPHTAEQKTVFTADEIKVLWDDYHNTDDVLTAAMLIMLYTGMRPGEMTDVLCRNIHLDEHYLTGGKKTTKGKNRKIILPDCILPVVRDLMQRAVNGKLYPYKAKNQISKAWVDKRDALGLRKELVPYCCRHTYITNLTALNVSPAMLQELAGHEDYETTLNYTHLSIADRLDAVNKL